MADIAPKLPCQPSPYGFPGAPPSAIVHALPPDGVLCRGPLAKHRMDMAVDQSRHYSATCCIQYRIGGCPIAFGIEGCDPTVFNPNPEPSAEPARR